MAPFLTHNSLGSHFVHLYWESVIFQTQEMGFPGGVGGEKRCTVQYGQDSPVQLMETASSFLLNSLMRVAVFFSRFVDTNVAPSPGNKLYAVLRTFFGKTNSILDKTSPSIWGGMFTIGVFVEEQSLHLKPQAQCQNAMTDK